MTLEPEHNPREAILNEISTKIYRWKSRRVL